MSHDQALILVILMLTVAMFLWGRWRHDMVAAGSLLACSVGAAALGLLPAAVAFALGVLASMVLRTVPPRSVYDAIDWPVIVLLAASIPVAGAMETTGTADLIVTMFLSDLMNNAATAAVMCPIAIGTAVALQVSPDSFPMAVAFGEPCSCKRADGSDPPHHGFFRH